MGIYVKPNVGTKLASAGDRRLQATGECGGQFMAAFRERRAQDLAEKLTSQKADRAEICRLRRENRRLRSRLHEAERRLMRHGDDLPDED